MPNLTPEQEREIQAQMHAAGVFESLAKASRVVPAGTDDYVCPQCGIDKNGARMHQKTHHNFPTLGDDAKARAEIEEEDAVIVSRANKDPHVTGGCVMGDGKPFIPTPDPFWMVWRIGHSGPTQAHASYELAKTEAERLAEKHQGERFVVLQSISESQSVVIQRQTVTTKHAVPIAEST